MMPNAIHERFREICCLPLPLPGAGKTAQRHKALAEIARENISLARLAEAHFDALAILAEAGKTPASGALYGVWAAEIPGKPLSCTESANGLSVSGTKMFCSGAGIVDRALVTAGAPHPCLMDIDLHDASCTITIDTTEWKTSTFAATNTATVTFTATQVSRDHLVSGLEWYLDRPGFWHGACGPAACWAGGAMGIVDFARQQFRSDPHTLAHLGAMEAAVWAMSACLDAAGNEIDRWPQDADAAHRRALMCRHQIEQSCAEILLRFGRAYGPYPLAFHAEMSARCQELALYLRQCHAERDLAKLGELLFADCP